MLGRVKGIVEKFLGRIAPYLPRNPDALTIAGLAAAALSLPAALIRPLIPLLPISIALSGIFDALDGVSARYNRRVSRSGAFLDSALDRFGDALMIISIALAPGVDAIALTEAYASLVGSLLTSYMRARAEALGLSMLGVGFFERPERLIYLLVLAIIYLAVGSRLIVVYGLGILAALTLATAIQRTIVGYRLLRNIGQSS